MSTLRPYTDYVRRGDKLLVGIYTYAATLMMEIADAFDQGSLFRFLQRHNLSLYEMDSSYWNPYSGGPLSITVIAQTDFASTSDVADAVAQAVQDMGFRTQAVWGGSPTQAATFLEQVPDSVSPDQTVRSGIKITTPPPDLGPFLMQGPKDLVNAVVPDLGNPFATSGQTWLIVIGAVAALFLLAEFK